MEDEIFLTPSGNGSKAPEVKAEKSQKATQQLSEEEKSELKALRGQLRDTQTALEEIEKEIAHEENLAYIRRNFTTPELIRSAEEAKLYLRDLKRELEEDVTYLANVREENKLKLEKAERELDEIVKQAQAEFQTDPGKALADWCWEPLSLRKNVSRLDEMRARAGLERREFPWGQTWFQTNMKNPSMREAYRKELIKRNAERLKIDLETEDWASAECLVRIDPETAPHVDEVWFYGSEQSICRAPVAIIAGGQMMALEIFKIGDCTAEVIETAVVLHRGGGYESIKDAIEAAKALEA